MTKLADAISTFKQTRGALVEANRAVKNCEDNLTRAGENLERQQHALGIARHRRNEAQELLRRTADSIPLLVAQEISTEGTTPEVDTALENYQAAKACLLDANKALTDAALAASAAENEMRQRSEELRSARERQAAAIRNRKAAAEKLPQLIHSEVAGSAPVDQEEARA